VVNVLLAHGGVGRFGRALDLEDATLDAGWDYVALGDYHVKEQVGARAWYSGSLEYVSTDPWGELRQEARDGVSGKGWLAVDLPKGEPVFQPVALARAIVDLPSISGEFRLPTEISADIDAAAASAPDGAVARLVVHDVKREIGRELDYAMIRAHKGRLLHFHLDLRRPKEEAAMERIGRKLENFDQMVRGFLEGRAKEPDFPKELDAAEFVETGMRYVAAAGRRETTAA